MAARRIIKSMLAYKPLTLLFAVTLALCSCKEATKWIASYGFVPITPPSTLLQPGAMIMKKRFANAGTKVVCSAEDSLGANYKPADSKTITGKFTRARKAGWHVDADILQQIHATTNSQAIRDVYVQVDNARIVNVTDTDVLRYVRERSRACSVALNRRRAAGYDISMIKTALIGDVSYQVKYQTDANIDVSAKLAQMQQVAVTLGGNVQSITENQAKATGLVWGVQDSVYLGAIGDQDADVQWLKRRSILMPSQPIAPEVASPAPTPGVDEPAEPAYLPESAPGHEDDQADVPFWEQPGRPKSNYDWEDEGQPWMDQAQEAAEGPESDADASQHVGEGQEADEPSEGEQGGQAPARRGRHPDTIRGS